jgi:hypothetical protein
VLAESATATGPAATTPSWLQTAAALASSSAAAVHTSLGAVVCTAPTVDAATCPAAAKPALDAATGPAATTPSWLQTATASPRTGA